MILLTLMNSGVSVAFSYVSKDFWNALNNKDVGEFYEMMVKFGGALVVGAPVQFCTGETYNCTMYQFLRKNCVFPPKFPSFNMSKNTNVLPP